jgi:hypothetical protein
METTGNVWKEGVVSAVQKAAAWFGTPRSNENGKPKKKLATEVVLETNHLERGRKFEAYVRRLVRVEFPVNEGWQLLHNKSIPKHLRDNRMASPGRPDWLCYNPDRGRIGIFEVKDVSVLTRKHIEQLSGYKNVLKRQSYRYIVIADHTVVEDDVQKQADSLGITIRRCKTNGSKVK